MTCCCSVVSDALRPHGLQHTRHPCPSLSPGVCSNYCPLNQWCHPAISSSVITFFSCTQYFPASGSFPMIRLLASDAKVLELCLTSAFPMNIQSWFPLGLTRLVSFQSKGLPRVFFSTTVWNHGAQPSSQSNSYICTWLLENHSFD